jgi:hypothetical protein
MPALRASVVRTLRSRRLAVALITALAAYTIVSTLVPQGEAADPAVREWAQARPAVESVVTALGLHHAYATPAFLALVGLLALATAACAWERTRRADRTMRSAGILSESLLERLTRRPETSAVVPPGADPLTALEKAAEGLERMGLRVRRRPGSVDGRAGMAGVWGSPLFHWSLVALMLVAGAGQVTRSEGFLALPLGERVADAHTSYLQVTDGALFGERHTGIEFVASKLDRHYVADGVDFGATPFITAYEGGVEVAAGWVHPNDPLRIGSLMVHMADFGPAVTLALESTGGAEISRETFTLDRSGQTSSGTTPQEFTLSGGPGAPAVKVRAQVLVWDGSAEGTLQTQVSRAILETSTVGSGAFGPPVVVAAGEALDLPGGQRLRVVRVGDWVRVSLANDWSVPFIYSLLLIATVALGVAVLVAARRASVLLVEDDDGVWSLHAGTWHSRTDPGFRTRVAGIVRDAANAQESS